MAEGNAQIFLRASESFNRAMTSGDAADWRRYLEEFVDPEIEWVNAPGAIEPGVKHGHAGMNAVFENFHSAFESLQAETERVIEAGDRVVSFGVFRGRGRESDVGVDVAYGIVLTFRDGKVVRWENFNEPAEALEAVGLRE